MNVSRRLRRTALVAAAMTASLTVAGVGLAATGGSPNGPSGKAASAAKVVSAPVMSPGSELKYFTIQPCRIVDTRVFGGALINTSRTFKAFTPYGTQGGNLSGCGIPTYAKALNLNLTAIPTTSSPGYTRGYPAGTSEPTASLVSYKGGASANMVTLPITSGASNFTLKNYGKAHMVVDVLGYWSKPLYVAVSSGGSIYNGTASGVVSTTRTGTGAYDVTFERSVAACSASATDIIFASTNDVSVDLGYNGDNQVATVRVTNSSGTPSDTYFYLALTC